MVDIDAALVAAVTGDSGVMTVIGTRFFPFGGRQGESYPYAAYQRISHNGAAHLDGASSLDWPRFQIDIWAEKYSEALAASEALRALLDGRQHGTAPDDFFATLQDLRGPAPDEETRKYRVSHDYHFWHERT